MRKSIHTAEYAVLLEELRRARNDAGISQREVGNRLDVPHSWVAKVESGERRIDLIEFFWFINACGRNPVQAIERIAAQLPSGRKKGNRK